MTRLRTAAAVGLALLLLACGESKPMPEISPPWEPMPGRTTTPPPTSAPARPQGMPETPPDTWLAWALLDRRTGQVRAGGQGGTNTTESMIKVAIVADYLAGLEARSPSGTETQLMTSTIRDSANDAAQQLYVERGQDAALRRVIATCRLTGVTLKNGWWSETGMTATAASQLGDCIADQRVAGPRWTPWLLAQMRAVRGDGRFGISDVAPGAAIKNGWTLRKDGWHVNCLGVTDVWSLAVLTRYPTTKARGLNYGKVLCGLTAAALLRDL